MGPPPPHDNYENQSDARYILGGCNDVRSALEQHEHTPRHPKAKDRSNGADKYRETHASKDADLLDSIDAEISNWCGKCQRILLGCVHTEHEDDTATRAIVAFKFVAAEYALALAQSGRSRWDYDTETVARKAADDKVDRVVKMPSSNPASWEPGFYLSSIVNWIVNWTKPEIRSKVGTHLKRREANPVPDRAVGGRGVSDEVIDAIENSFLGETWETVAERMIREVADLPHRGKIPHPPETLLTWYQARFTAWKFHGDGRYSAEKKSDRQLAAHLPGISFATVSRFRREDLVPTLSALRDNAITAARLETLASIRDNQHVSEEQQRALAVLNSETMRLNRDHYEALSSLHDVPGLTEAQYAAVAALHERAQDLMEVVAA